jgi:PAS domain-containing protein
VRPRALAAEPLVLYIYRDGRYEPEINDAWWTAPGLPTATIDLRTGTIMRASREWSTLIGDGSERLEGRAYSDFLVPAAREAALETIEALRESRELTSQVVLQRHDGSVLIVAFHAVLEGDRVDIVYQPLQRHDGASTAPSGVD